MIDREHALSITQQAEALGISRGSVYYLPRPVSDADLKLMRRIDELHLEYPFAGARMLRDLLRTEGYKAGRKHIGTLMAKMGIEALYRRPNTSRAHPAQKRFTQWIFNQASWSWPSVLVPSRSLRRGTTRSPKSGA